MVRHLFRKRRILVVGAGDLGTGVIFRLYSAGFRPLVSERQAPLAIRHEVSLCSAVYYGRYQVEHLESEHVSDELAGRQIKGLKDKFPREGAIPVFTLPFTDIVSSWSPDVLIDARLMKKHDTISMDMAPLVIALGPGITAGVDAHLVVETMRGHHLGRLIRQGQAEKNTGIPGDIGGYSSERVIHAPQTGRLHVLTHVGKAVNRGEAIAVIVPGESCEDMAQYIAKDPGDEEAGFVINAPVSGVIRGMLRDKTMVWKGLKMADIDPRCSLDACRTVSDKALAVGGAVLEAVCADLSG